MSIYKVKQLYGVNGITEPIYSSIMEYEHIYVLERTETNLDYTTTKFFTIIDKKGTVIIKEDYMTVGSFWLNRAVITFKTGAFPKYKIIDEYGKFLNDKTYTYASDCAEEMFVVAEGQDYYFLDINGNAVNNLKYIYASKFMYGRAYVKTNSDENYFINHKFEKITENFRNSYLYRFHLEDYAVFEEQWSNKTFVMDYAQNIYYETPHSLLKHNNFYYLFSGIKDFRVSLDYFLPFKEYSEYRKVVDEITAIESYIIKKFVLRIK